MNTRKKTTLANRVLKLSHKARALYQKKDEAFAQLLNACAAGEVIETKHGRFEIIDNFASRNVGYRPASFHRFELKEIKPPKQRGAGSSPTDHSHLFACVPSTPALENASVPSIAA